MGRQICTSWALRSRRLVLYRNLKNPTRSHPETDVCRRATHGAGGNSGGVDTQEPEFWSWPVKPSLSLVALATQGGS